MQPLIERLFLKNSININYLISTKFKFLFCISFTLNCVQYLVLGMQSYELRRCMA